MCTHYYRVFFGGHSRIFIASNIPGFLFCFRSMRGRCSGDIGLALASRLHSRVNKSDNRNRTSEFKQKLRQ